MKKLIFTISLLLFCILAMAQTPTVGVFTGRYVATPTTQIGVVTVPGTFILITSTGDMIQTLKSNQKANATITSIKALGTLYYKEFPGTMTGNLLIGGTLNVTGTATFNVLPSFTLAAGTATPTVLADTVGVAIAGLTTNSIVVCSYYGAGGAIVMTTDTIAYVRQVRAGWLTLGGKNGRAIHYFVGKK